MDKLRGYDFFKMLFILCEFLVILQHTVSICLNEFLFFLLLFCLF